MRFVREVLPNGRVRFTRWYYFVFWSLVALLIFAVSGKVWMAFS